MWPVVGLVATLLSGGAMGAFITHYYATRQTVINYSINTTSLGAGEATRNILPTLKLQLDNAEIPAVYTHTVELRHGAGPELEKASVSIALAGAKLLGNPVVYGPDPVHQIICKYDEPNYSVICSMGRMSANNNSYRVLMATDRLPEITLGIDGKDARIEKSSIAQQKDVPSTLILFLSSSAVFWVAILSSYAWKGISVMRKKL